MITQNIFITLMIKNMNPNEKVLDTFLVRDVFDDSL